MRVQLICWYVVVLVEHVVLVAVCIVALCAGGRVRNLAVCRWSQTAHAPSVRVSGLGRRVSRALDSPTGYAIANIPLQAKSRPLRIPTSRSHAPSASPPGAVPPPPHPPQPQSRPLRIAPRRSHAPPRPLLVPGGGRCTEGPCPLHPAGLQCAWWWEIQVINTARSHGKAALHGGIKARERGVGEWGGGSDEF